MYLGLGGNSQKWANRLMIDSNPSIYFNNLLKNKFNFKTLLNYFNLNINDFKIQNKLNIDDFDLNKSIWPKKILRIQNDINFIRLIKEKFDLYINFNANSFILDGQRFDEISSHNNIKIKAKTFILGCGGIENSKILLRTKYKNISNLDKNNLIGKFLSDHPKKKVFKLKSFNSKLDFLLPDYNFRYKYQLGLNLSEKIIQKENIFKLNYNMNYKLNNKYEMVVNKIIENIKMKKDLFKIQNYKVLLNNIYYHIPKENFIYFYYYVFNKIKKKPTNLEYFVDIFTEQPSKDYNNIQLINIENDKFKINNYVENDLLESIDKSNFYFKQFLKRQIIEFDEVDETLTDASHILCTTRASSKPDSGVVDQYCKIHNFDNVFVTGSSCFPSVEFYNPTLLIMLQSLNTLDYILSDEYSI